MIKCLTIGTMILNILCADQLNNNRIVFDEAANQQIVYGFATIEVFSNPLFNDWYFNEYEDYTPNREILDSLKSQLYCYTIQIVMGTWCGDSRREVPRFIKLLNAMDFPIEQLTIIGVNREKCCPEAGVNEGYVDYVPTFIIYRDDREVGRIIEHPINSLEEDLFSILFNSNYNMQR